MGGIDSIGIDSIGIGIGIVVPLDIFGYRFPFRSIKHTNRLDVCWMDQTPRAFVVEKIFFFTALAPFPTIEGELGFVAQRVFANLLQTAPQFSLDTLGIIVTRRNASDRNIAAKLDTASIVGTGCSSGGPGLASGSKTRFESDGWFLAAVTSTRRRWCYGWALVVNLRSFHNHGLDLYHLKAEGLASVVVGVVRVGVGGCQRALVGHGTGVVR
jgi:hypothetical protein